MHDFSELITGVVHMIKMKLFEDKIGSRLNLFFQHGTNVSINDPRNLALDCESKMCTTVIAVREGHDYIVYMSAMYKYQLDFS